MILRIIISAPIVALFFALPVYLIASEGPLLIVFIVKYAGPSFLIAFILFGYSKGMIYQRIFDGSLLNEEDVSEHLSLSIGNLEELEE